MTMEQIIIRYIDLPCSSKGYVRRDTEGDYNIYINARLSYDTQQAAIQHEMAHIENGDFDNDVSIERVEERAKKR